MGPELATRNMQRRAFVVVIDACGVGELPDAARYGDAGANTLLHVAQAVGGLELPTFGRLGLGNILDLPGVAPSRAPVLHGRLAPLGPGKDSSTGHWELMGVVVEEPPPTYPDGLPAPLRDHVETTIGSPVICNRPQNGIAAIEEYGEEHLAGGWPILYTSQDSVIQLAAHTSVISAERLYAMCAALRASLQAPGAVRRVIAPPAGATTPCRRRRPASWSCSRRPASRFTESARRRSCLPGSASVACTRGRPTGKRSRAWSA
jgi:phosphopentomutase